jgi:hypothetical protein
LRVAPSPSWSKGCGALLTKSWMRSNSAHSGLRTVTVTSTIPLVVASMVFCPTPSPAVWPVDGALAPTVTNGALVPLARPLRTFAASVSACAGRAAGAVTAEAT